MEPLISVIIPVYNIEAYVERSVQSVCAQTYRNLEIIIVDDGSTDETGRIIDRLAEQDTRIIPIHKQNGGVSAARNTGIDRAKGAYIGFVDGDDLIAEDMYAFLLQNAQKYQADISHCGYQMVFPDRRDDYYGTGKLIIQEGRQGVRDLLQGTLVEPGLCNKLYKHELFANCRLNTEIKIMEDLLMNYYLFSNASRAVFQDEMKYYYMVRKNSAATSKNEHHIQDPMCVLQEIIAQESGVIRDLAMKRYLAVLTNFVVTKKSDLTAKMQTSQREKKAELEKAYRDYSGLFSKSEQLQIQLAIKSPALYRAVHFVYGTLKGSRNKYRVKEG